MERYYKKETQGNSRTKRNTRLYNSIYSYGKYSNIEGIASIDNTNEIDITKVKRCLIIEKNIKQNGDTVD